MIGVSNRLKTTIENKPAQSEVNLYSSLLQHQNEMNRALGHLCAHIGQTRPGEHPEDGEMI